MYLVGLLFGLGETVQTDQLTETEDGYRVRYRIIDCDPRDIRDSETWTRW